MEDQSVSTKLATGIARILLHLSKPENRNETNREVLLGVAGDACDITTQDFLNHFIDDGIPDVTDKQIANAVKGDYSEICTNITPFLEYFDYPAPLPNNVHP